MKSSPNQTQQVSNSNPESQLLLTLLASYDQRLFPRVRRNYFSQGVRKVPSIAHASLYR